MYSSPLWILEIMRDLLVGFVHIVLESSFIPPNSIVCPSTTFFMFDTSLERLWSSFLLRLTFLLQCCNPCYS